MPSQAIRALLIIAVAAPAFAVSGCAQPGVNRVGASVHIGYRSPWRWRGGYYAVPVPIDDIDPEPELPIEPPPVAVPLPEPDFGGGWGGGDFGGGDFGGGDFGGDDFGGDF